MAVSQVHVCDATDCAYNGDKICHAKAITVGEANAANCATYTTRHDKGGTRMTVANVGACKASDCKYNENLYCAAEQIDIGFRQQQVSCLTYDKR